MNGLLAIQAALISDHLKAIKFPSGHWLMEEKPAETSAALKDFFGNLIRICGSALGLD